MNQPNWASVVLAAYDSEQGTVQWMEEVGEDHDHRSESWPANLREVTELSDDEIAEALRFAERTQLLSQVGSGIHYELTQKGFDVAHERELRESQQDLVESQTQVTGTQTNFTIILGVTALVQALASVVTARRYTLILSLIYLVLLVLLLVKREELFYYPS